MGLVYNRVTINLQVRIQSTKSNISRAITIIDLPSEETKPSLYHNGHEPQWTTVYQKKEIRMCLMEENL